MRAIAKTLSLVSLISHFFCCFLPGMISLFTLITLTGTAVVTMEDFGIPEAVHEKMIYISALVLLISGIANYTSWKMDCSKVCAHGDCAPKKSQYFRFYGYSVAFFILNAIIHFGTHTEHTHAEHYPANSFKQHSEEHQH